MAAAKHRRGTPRRPSPGMSPQAHARRTKTAGVAQGGIYEAPREALKRLPSFGGEAVDPVVGLGAGEGAERLADAVLEALDAVLAPPLGR
jgi:hypothetical protein